MLPRQEQYPPQVDQTFPVKPQGFDGCPTSRGQAQQQGVIVVPDEMLVSVLQPRMKQRYHFCRDRVIAFGLIVLVVVAALAGKGQVVGYVLTTRLLGIMCSIENDWVAKPSWLRQYSQQPPALATTSSRRSLSSEMAGF